MTAPLRVHVERPRRSTAAHIGGAVGRVGGWFLTAYLVMLLLPAAAHWSPGYGQCLAIVLVVVLLQNSGDWLRWTHAAPKKVRR